MTITHGHIVNLMFDHQTESLHVDADSDGAGVTVTPLEPGPLWIRLPLWADRSDLKVESSATHRVLDNYVLLGEPHVGEAVKVSYPLADSEIVLHHRTRDIRARLRGDSVISMDDFGADLTFYPPIVQ